MWKESREVQGKEMKTRK